MHHTNQRTNHIAYCIALGDYKGIKFPSSAKTRVKVAGVGDTVRADESLTHHQNLVWDSEFDLI